MGEEGAFAYVTHFASLIINMDRYQIVTYIYRKGECIMLRLSDHAIKMMEQRLRIENNAHIKQIRL